MAETVIECNMKICKKCNKEKSLDDFYKDITKDGHKNICKQCCIASRKQYYRDNIERECKYSARRYRENIGNFRAKLKEYKKNNPEKVAESIARWHKKNQGKIRIFAKKWKEDNIERFATYYRRANAKRSLNTNYRIHRNISNAIARCINKNRTEKRTFEILGYTTEELKTHLESLFLDGMTWANYSKWHIDHKIPRSFFVFDSPDDVEFKMCWRLENLQPMWAKDNLAKGNKIRRVA